MKVKKENEKVGLKLNIQKTKIMASSPFTSWQTDGETMETLRDLFWEGVSSPFHSGPRQRYTYAKPRQHMRDITLLTKVHIVKAMIFPVVI